MFVQFLTSLNELKLNLFSDMVLKGMLDLIVTIVRMHCSNQIDHPEQAGQQDAQLGVKGVSLLHKMLTQDERTLPMLNPDRIMLLSFNLGRLIESADSDEKDLGLSMSMYFLRHHLDVVLSDICFDE